MSNNEVSSFWWEDDGTFFIEFKDGQIIGYENAYISSISYGDLEEGNDAFKTEELPNFTIRETAMTSWLEQVCKK